MTSALPLPTSNITGKTGWPWELPASAALPPLMPDGTPWPKISVITPSYNQGQFLEQTIRSVLMQGYPALEYIVMDGGSTDESPALLRQYDAWLSAWVSERDRGQSHAINKGLAQATGEILCWLNSDDYFMPGALQRVALTLAQSTGNAALVGHCLKVNVADGTTLPLAGRFAGRQQLLQFWQGYHMHQPAIFWRREVFEAVGWLDETLHLTMDFDYWARIAERFDFFNVDAVLAACHYHEAAKTGDECAGYHQELRKNARQYWGAPWRKAYWQLEYSFFHHFYYLPWLKKLKAFRPRRAELE